MSTTVRCNQQRNQQRNQQQSAQNHHIQSNIMNCSLSVWDFTQTVAFLYIVLRDIQECELFLKVDVNNTLHKSQLSRLSKILIEWSS